MSAGITELVNTVRKEESLTIAKTRSIIETVIKAIPELAKDEGLIIRGFGTFKYKTRQQRKGRNFHNGLAVVIPPKEQLTFKPVGDL